MVEVWPEGKEWKLESRLKKLKSKLLFSKTVLGLGLPTTCLIIWVKIPVIINEIKTAQLKIKKFLYIVEYFNKFVKFFVIK